VARSSFQGRTREIPGSIPSKNNTWLVRMPLCISQISRPPLMGRKPVRKKKSSLNVNVSLNVNESYTTILTNMALCLVGSTYNLKWVKM